MNTLLAVSSLALSIALASPAIAVESAEAAPAASATPQTDTETDAIIVTGTREAARTQFEAMAPVDVLSQALVGSSVSGDLNDRLAQLLPSFNVQRLPAADGQAFVRPATLRGLSADHTLVLVNGRRFHRSALLGSRGAQSADLAAIPNLAVGQIEVLRDGASAQYGSDAIAGVINIILDEQPGMHAMSQVSRYYAGDGDEYLIGLRGGSKLGERGFFSVTGEWNKQEATSRTRQRPDAIAFQAANPGLAVPNPVQRWGQPDLETLKGSANLRYDLAPEVTLHALVIAQQGEGVTDFNWRNPASTGSVFNPSTAFPGFTFRTLYPTGFTPRFATRYHDLQANGGFSGALGEALTYDVSAGFGTSVIDYRMNESLNASLGPSSPTSFYLGRLEQREVQFNADFVYRIPLGTAAPINAAFGYERRQETYRVGLGDPASYAIGPGAATGLAPNSNGFPGFGPLQAGSFKQTSNAGYLDLEWQAAPILTLGAAGRYENYSSFGDSFTYKVSARLEPITGLALRATHATGFRAPTPGQTNSRSVTQGLDTTTMQIFNTGRLSPGDPLAIALGAKPLQPETSRSTTVGLAWRPSAGLNVTLDAYQIDVSDRFGESATFAVPAAFANPNRFTAVRYFTNDFATQTRGIDLVVNLRSRLGGGTLNTALAYNYNQTRVASGTSAAIANATQRRIFQERLPAHNATGSVSYALGPIDLMLRGRYYGPWTDVSGNATGELFQRFGGIAMFDAAVTVKVGQHVSVKVGAENLFGTYPAEATNQAVRGLIYSRNAPYDTDGGQYYARLDLRF
ncbi:MAG: TonB-dependent receptor [Sphingomonadales bacterium]|nr:TonB-dependent receptor [Sphingomonadales bacterium]